MSDVLVQYKREGLAYEGTVSIVEDGNVLQEERFRDAQYPTMCTSISRMLRAMPNGTGLVFLRTERVGLIPMRVSQDRVDLLREDPVQYIRETTYKAEEVGEIRKAVQPATTSVPYLKVGLDTLADSFGEVVYIKRKCGDVECPFCGVWAPLQSAVFQCRCCDHLLNTVDGNERWLGVRVEELLAAETVSRFFLPHKPWNDYKNWISRGDLGQKLEEYKKEKEHVRAEAR